MNTKLIRKIEQRLENLEEKADHLKNQLINIESFNRPKNQSDIEKIQLELDETLNKIKHINSVNKKN